VLLWLRSRHGADLVAGWSFAWAKLRRAFAVPRLPEPPLRVLLSGSTAVGGTTALSDTSPRWRADLRRTQIHDSPPAALNAGFAPHCRRSDARGLTSQIDPQAALHYGVNEWRGRGRIADLRAPLPHSSFWCEWQRLERLRMHREAAERVRSEGCGDGTSAASRPQAIRIRPMRGLLLRASKTNRSSSHCLTNRNNCWFRQI